MTKNTTIAILALIGEAAALANAEAAKALELAKGPARTKLAKASAEALRTTAARGTKAAGALGMAMMTLRFAPANKEVIMAVLQGLSATLNTLGMAPHDPIRVPLQGIGALLTKKG